MFTVLLSPRPWAALALSILCACSTPPSPSTSPEPPRKPLTAPVWEGRLHLRIDSAPPQQYSAEFQLLGSAEEGELRLLSPLGQTLAHAHWSALGCELRQNRSLQHFANTDEMTLAMTGAVLPLSGIFAWLAGDNSLSIPGWQIVRARSANSASVVVRRSNPAPALTLTLLPD